MKADSAALKNTPHENTLDLTDLQQGDLLLALNAIDQGEIDHRKGISGHCRIVHCDRDFNLKGEFWTGETGLLVGLIYNPNDRRLYATNPKANSFYAYSINGEREDINDFLPKRRFGNMLLAHNGDIVVGIHSLHGDQQSSDEHGDGKLARFNPQSKTFAFYPVEIDGGRGGKHCVSSLAIGSDDHIIYYASEAGQRLSRYNTQSREQLPDFVTFAEDSPLKTYGIAPLPDGRVLMASSVGATLLDPNGAIIKNYEVTLEKGWTRAKLALDPSYFFLINFSQGILQRREVESGEVVAELNTGLQASLLSIVEIP